MTFKRLLYAPNIHQGGGMSLLLPLLEALKDEADVMFVLDERIELPEGLSLVGKVHRVKATLFSRLRFELEMPHLVTVESLLLCMGNLPPLFAHKCHQQVFVQNRYLIDDVSLNEFGLSVRLRLMLERWWLNSRACYVRRFIVQTPTMQVLMKSSLGVEAEVLPFVANMKAIESNAVEIEKLYDFLYVASGEPHKNHKILVKAWIELAREKLFPSLCLTLDARRFPELSAWVASESYRYGLNISMIGECSYTEMQELYLRSRAMIYPSLFESFGLPLIEATRVGLPVLAGKLPFVEDVINSKEFFDPDSASSIAYAVRQFSFSPVELNFKPLTVDEFIHQVFRKEDTSE